MHPRSHISKPARRQCLPLSRRMFTIFVTCSTLLVSSSGSRLQKYRSSQQTSMLRGRGGDSRYAEEMLDEDDARRRNSYDDSSDMMAPDYDDVEETSSNLPPDLNHPGTSGTSHPPEEPYQGQVVSSNPIIYGSESQYDIDSNTLSTNPPNETGGTEATGPATGVRDPFLSLPKMTYALGEPVVVSFDTGNPDKDVRNWVVGMYMRDANPQDGSLPPIVSIKLCGLLTCETSVHAGTVKFNKGAAINGDWPMDVNEYGTGYDVFILDEYGSEVTDAAMFNVDLDESYSSFPPANSYQEEGSSTSIPVNAQTGTLTPPPQSILIPETYQEQDISSNSYVYPPTQSKSDVDNISSAFSTTHVTENEVTEESASREEVIYPSLTLSKTEYLYGERVVVNFNTGDRDEDVKNWVIGIYMRDANPQGGVLPPIVSMKLCGLLTCDTSVHSGTVEFSDLHRAAMTGQWPVDIDNFGTGYDIFMLNEYGEEVSEAYEFNVVIDEAV